MADPRGPDAAPGNVAVKLHSRKAERAAFAQHIQHAIPAAGLLAAAWQSLTAGAHGLELALAVAEIATSALLIGGILRSARTLRAHDDGHAPHVHRIDWLDIFAAGVLFTEAAEHWHLTHHVKGPTVLLAFVTLAIGLTHGRMRSLVGRRRALELTADHLFVPGKPFRSIKARWRDIHQITLTEHEAEILLRSGRRRRIDLRDLRNAAEVREALTTAQRRLAPGAW
jgi:hypothetical protein